MILKLTFSLFLVAVLYSCLTSGGHRLSNSCLAQIATNCIDFILTECGLVIFSFPTCANKDSLEEF